MLSNKIKSIQHNAALAMNAAIKGTSTQKLYQDIGLESLENRIWLRLLCYFHKIL